MLTFEHTIKDPVGLHAKPARQLAEIVRHLDSKVMICAQDRSADAAKLIRVISMGLVTGTKITVTIEGGDEQRAMDELHRFFSEKV